MAFRGVVCRLLRSSTSVPQVRVILMVEMVVLRAVMNENILYINHPIIFFPQSGGTLNLSFPTMTSPFGSFTFAKTNILLITVSKSC